MILLLLCGNINFMEFTEKFAHALKKELFYHHICKIWNFDTILVVSVDVPRHDFTFKSKLLKGIKTLMIFVTPLSSKILFQIQHSSVHPSPIIPPVDEFGPHAPLEELDSTRAAGIF